MIYHSIFVNMRDLLKGGGTMHVEGGKNRIEKVLAIKKAAIIGFWLDWQSNKMAWSRTRTGRWHRSSDIASWSRSKSSKSWHGSLGWTGTNGTNFSSIIGSFNDNRGCQLSVMATTIACCCSAATVKIQFCREAADVLSTAACWAWLSIITVSRRHLYVGVR